ncbi:thioredoxin-like [Eleutherodactylus coqui]|uniref:thioredoxin-like n=1 Tax=Eleutherodactylus coqui TaxID=57060 RepID=UPI0034624A5B
MARVIGNMGDLKAFLDIPANKLVVIDFLALWCGPCKMIAPFFNGLVEKYPDVVFIEVDVDDAQEVAAYCEVRSVPTFQFHKNGERDDFKHTLSSADGKLVVVDFTVLWCLSCKMIAPLFEEMSKKHPDVVFIKVDVDDAQEVAAYCDIRKVPTFQFYKNGERIYELTRANPSRLEQKVQELK